MTETQEGINIETLESEITPDIVAIRCQSYTFAGKPLHPMTKQRALSATLLGICGFGRSIPTLPDGTPDSGALHDDLMRFIWLLSVNDSRARSAPLNRPKAYEEAFEWWCDNCEMGEGPFVEAYEVWRSTCEDLGMIEASVDSTGRVSTSADMGE